MLRLLMGGLLLLSLGSCRRSPVEPHRTAPPRVDVSPAEVDPLPTLAEIADAIDPGPLPALRVEAPRWLQAALSDHGPPGAEKRLARARTKFEAFEAKLEIGADDDALARALVDLVEALMRAEEAAGELESASVEALVLLEQIYRRVDAPQLANARSLSPSLLRSLVSRLNRRGTLDDAVALGDVTRFGVRVLEESGALHRRTVASLLRAAPEDPAVPDALAHIAAAGWREDEALAVGIIKRALELRGDAATAADWLDLAALCHRTLDLECGQQARAEAIARAPADDAELRGRLEQADLLADSAREAVELADAAGLDDGLARGEALVALERYAEATALYVQLSRRHRDDARPVFGQARVMLVDRLDFVGAYELLQYARPTEHRGRAWYELTIGVRATAVLRYLLPQVADRDPQGIFDALRPDLLAMRKDIEALEALGSDEGRVLRFLYGLGMEVWPKLQAADPEVLRSLARGLLSRVEALRAELPHSHHAYTLSLAAAEFSDDRESALALLDLEPPEDEVRARELALRRARAAIDLVATWDAADRAEQMLTLVDAAMFPGLPRGQRRLAIDARAIAWRLGGGSAAELDEIVRRYWRLAHETGGSGDPALLNNVAVVMAAQGQMARAQPIWGFAMESAGEDDRDLPRLNLLASLIEQAGGKATDAYRVELRKLARDGRTIEVRLQAQAWLVAAAPDKATRRKEQAALRRAAAEEAAENYRPRNLPGRGGVIVRDNMEMGLGYSTLESLQLSLDVSGTPWLVLPCPVAVPDPRGP